MTIPIFHDLGGKDHLPTHLTPNINLQMCYGPHSCKTMLKMPSKLKTYNENMEQNVLDFEPKYLYETIKIQRTPI